MKYWIIESMNTIKSQDGLTDVVETVFWSRSAKEIFEDVEYVGNLQGATWCSAPDPMSFTPYQDLTFEQVCGWIESNVNVVELDAKLDSQIELQKNPPIVQLPLPWNQ